MFDAILALILAAASAPDAALAAGHPVAEPVILPLTFHQGSKKGFIFCRGLAIGPNALTARHCVREAQRVLDDKNQAFIRYGNHIIKLDRARVAKMVNASFAAQSASVSVDFNLFALDDLGPPKPLAAMPRLVARPIPNQAIVLDAGTNAMTTCRVVVVCGSSFSYKCNAEPSKSWSGSPIWSDGDKTNLLGVHLGEASSGFSKAAAALTIVGRSSALFATPEGFSDAVARSPAYAHRLDATCDAVDPSVTSTSKLKVRTIKAPRGMVHGLAATDEGQLLAVTITGVPLICALDGASNAWRCLANPIATSQRINAVTPWNGGYAYAEARLQPRDYASVTSLDLREGGISSVVFDRADRKPAVSSPRIVSTVGGLLSLTAIGPDLVGAGEKGVCVLAAGSTQCKRLCIDPTCKNEDWRVNGVTALGNNAFLAAGSDHKGRAIIPAFKRFDRTATGWRQTGGELGADIDASILAIGGRRTGLQLKAPVVMEDGTQLLFGSDGAAYEVRGARVVSRVPIRNSWMAEGVDHSRDVIEDAIRDAVPLPGNLVAVASSDGCIRFLKLERELGRPALQAAQDLTVYDRGIWITELERVGTFLYARAQDGGVTEIDFSGILSTIGSLPSPSLR